MTILPEDNKIYVRFASYLIVMLRNPKYVTGPWMLGAHELEANSTKNRIYTHVLGIILYHYPTLTKWFHMVAPSVINNKIGRE